MVERCSEWQYQCFATFDKEPIAFIDATLRFNDGMGAPWRNATNFSVKHIFIIKHIVSDKRSFAFNVFRCLSRRCLKTSRVTRRRFGGECISSSTGGAQQARISNQSRMSDAIVAGPRTAIGAIQQHVNPSPKWPNSWFQSNYLSLK